MSAAQPSSSLGGGIGDGSCMTPLGSMHYTTIPQELVDWGWEVCDTSVMQITPGQAQELLGWDVNDQ